MKPNPSFAYVCRVVHCVSLVTFCMFLNSTHAQIAVELIDGESGQASQAWYYEDAYEVLVLTGQYIAPEVLGTAIPHDDFYYYDEDPTVIEYKWGPDLYLERGHYGSRLGARISVYGEDFIGLHAPYWEREEMKPTLAGFRITPRILEDDLSGDESSYFRISDSSAPEYFRQWSLDGRDWQQALFRWGRRIGRPSLRDFWRALGVLCCRSC